MEKKNSISDEAAAAAELEQQAKAGPDISLYVHTFRQPFEYLGKTYDTLTFDWGTLTGKDHLAIENEIVRQGKTLVMPEFSGEFLCCMAARACTERTEEGFRVISAEMLRALPMREFQSICKRARSFLLRAE